MQTMHPKYSESCVDNGVKSDPMEPPPEPTYTQSRQSENVPRPSFPAAPPKIRVNHALFWLARQNMEIPVSVLHSISKESGSAIHK